MTAIKNLETCLKSPSLNAWKPPLCPRGGGVGIVSFVFHPNTQCNAERSWGFDDPYTFPPPGTCSRGFSRKSAPCAASFPLAFTCFLPNRKLASIQAEKIPEGKRSHRRAPPAQGGEKRGGAGGQRASAPPGSLGLTAATPLILPALLLSSVQSLSRVWLSVTLWTAARQAFLSITSSRSLLKLMSVELVMPTNSLILCGPLLLPPSIFPSIGVFSKE